MDDDILMKKVKFENSLMAFFNSYYKLVEFAMTTGSMKTGEDYDGMKQALQAAASDGRMLIGEIPNELGNEYMKDATQFLTLIVKRIENVDERYTHLKGKCLRTEQYSFSQDRVYVKTDRSLEKQIAKIGIKMNAHKDETMRMLNASLGW